MFELSPDNPYDDLPLGDAREFKRAAQERLGANLYSVSHAGSGSLTHYTRADDIKNIKWLNERIAQLLNAEPPRAKARLKIWKFAR